MATFAPDGELEFASGTSKGRDAIRAAVTSFSERIGQFYHTEDGELDWAMGVARGREAIRAEAQGFAAKIGEIFKDSAGRPAKLRHAVNQKAIRIEGDRAWNTGFWWEMTNGGPDGSIALPSFGVYEDELRRVDGRWLFSRRKIYNEFLPGRESGPANPVAAMDRAAQELA